MKKLILSTLLIGLSPLLFANNGIVKNNKILKTKVQNLKKTNNNDFCRVSCTMVIDNGFGGSTEISASAGSIFTSCETAQKNCHRKLMHELVDLVY